MLPRPLFLDIGIVNDKPQKAGAAEDFDAVIPLRLFLRGGAGATRMYEEAVTMAVTAQIREIPHVAGGDITAVAFHLQQVLPAVDPYDSVASSVTGVSPVSAYTAAGPSERVEYELLEDERVYAAQVRHLGRFGHVPRT